MTKLILKVLGRFGGKYYICATRCKEMKHIFGLLNLHSTIMKIDFVAWPHCDMANLKNWDLCHKFPWQIAQNAILGIREVASSDTSAAAPTL